jgi:protein TonB
VVAEYPSAARAAQIAGNVLLRATIGLDGAVTDVAVVESVHPLLDQAARKAVLQYVYRPALRNAVPEVATVVITVSFRLE